MFPLYFTVELELIYNQRKIYVPIIKSAIKRMKQTAVRRDRNVALKRDIKTATKAFVAKPTSQTLSAVQSEIDTAVKKNVLNKATAARRKAHFAAVAKAAGVKLSTKKVAKATAPATKKPSAKKKFSSFT